jgi:type II secretory pathway pseudopilin PulG
MPTLRVRPGYLLIELIAAVALLSLAVAALLPSVVGRSEASRQSELIERLADLDRRARLLSLREGPVRLTLDSERIMLRATPVQAESAVLRVPTDGWESRLLDSGTQTEVVAVLIDRLGRSQDYILLLERDGSRLTLQVDGRTGRVRTAEVAP